MTLFTFGGAVLPSTVILLEMQHRKPRVDQVGQNVHFNKLPKELFRQERLRRATLSATT